MRATQVPSSVPSRDDQAMQAAVMRHRGAFGEAPVFVRPEIPPERLAGAIDKYAPGVQAGEAVLLVDTSLKGNGKSGMLLTTRAVYGHEPMATHVVALDDIRSVETKGAFLLVNGLTIVGTVTLGPAAEAIVEILRGLAPTAAADPIAVVDGPPAATPATPMASAPGAPQPPPPPAEDSASTLLLKGGGFLLLAGLFAFWPVLSLLTILDGGCELQGLAYECVSTSGALRVETTILWPVALFLAFGAVVNVLRAIALVVAGMAKLRG